jgi:hypothetical protein
LATLWYVPENSVCSKVDKVCMSGRLWEDLSVTIERFDLKSDGFVNVLVKLFPLQSRRRAALDSSINFPAIPPPGETQYLN